MTRRIALLLLSSVFVLALVVATRTILVVPADSAPTAREVERIDEDAAVAHLAKALQFHTVSVAQDVQPDGEAFVGLIQHIQNTYPLIHRTLGREEVGAYNVLYTWQGSDPNLPGILFIAHMDVVPVEPESEMLWTHPPFSGEIADGFIWGRGAIDMKSSVIGLLEAVEHLLGQGMQPHRTIFLALGHDEEIGGKNGAALLSARLQALGIRLEYTLDEGSYVIDGVIPGVSRPVALIGLTEKGYLTLRLSAKAPGGHSALPSRNEAIARIARAIRQLDEKPMPASLGGVVSPMLDALAPEVPLAQRAVLANRWLFAPLLLGALESTPATNALVRTTMAPTMIAGGIKENVLPRDASATVNFRIRPGDTSENVIAHVRTTIDDPEIAIDQVGDSNDPLPIASINAPGYAALRSAAEAIYPDAVLAPGLVIGGTDTLHYAALAGNSYRFGPLRLAASDPERIHGVDERVAVRDYIDMIRFYVAVMRTAGD